MAGTGRTSRFDAITTPGGLFLIAALLISLMPLTGGVHDPDFWWHLRNGQLLMQKGALLGTDPYTYTVPTHQWVMHEWLTDVWFAAMYSAGGLGLIVLVLTLASWVGIIFLALRNGLRNLSHSANAIGVLVACLVALPIFGPRIQMVTFSLSIVVLFVTERYLKRGGPWLWILPPLFLVWSNLHSGFIIGLGFMAALLVGDTIAMLLRHEDHAPDDRLLGVLAILIVCCLVALINPNGPQILLYPFSTQASPAQQSLIVEWHSPNFHDWDVRTFGAMLISLAAFLAINRKITVRDLLLVLITAALSLQSIRNIALFVAAVTPIWTEQLVLAMKHLPSRSRKPARAPIGIRIITLVVLSFGVLYVYASERLLPAMAIPPDAATYAYYFPVCASRWLAEIQKPLRIFNQYGEGGYLAWRLTPIGDKIFIFGDAALMGDPLLIQYGDVESVRPDWEQIILNDYHSDMVLFDTGTPLARVLSSSPRWVMVYSDPHNQAFIPVTRIQDLNLPPQPPIPKDHDDACYQLSYSIKNPSL